MKKVLVGTNNFNKVKELKEAFKAFPYEFISLKDINVLADAPETCRTFAGNALQKACFYSKLTNLPCISEDSGLEVEALDNRPGVLSARWTGQHADGETNNKFLVSELNRINVSSSPAKYISAMAYVEGDRKIVVLGVLEGTIKSTPSGRNGFSYDPYFYVNNKSIGDMALKEKNQISHRFRAIENLLAALKGEK